MARPKTNLMAHAVPTASADAGIEDDAFDPIEGHSDFPPQDAPSESPASKPRKRSNRTKGKKEPQRRQHQVDTPPIVTWLFSLFLITLGILWLLSLVSYDVKDLPGGHFLSVQPRDPSAPTHNFLGQMGARIAGNSFFLFGFGAFLLCVSLLWLGLSRLVLGNRLGKSVWIGLGIIVFCGSALLQIQKVVPFEWAHSWKMMGAGGMLGWLIGPSIEGRIGYLGSMLVTTSGYLLGMILIAGIHPFDFILDIRKNWLLWIQKRKQNQLLKAIEHQQAELNRINRILPPEEEHPASTQHVPQGMQMVAETAHAHPHEFVQPEAPQEEMRKVVEEVEEWEPPLPLNNTPAPKIIDASVPRPIEVGKIPEVEQRLKARREASVEESGKAPMGSLESLFKNYQLPAFDLLIADHGMNKPPQSPQELLAIQQQIIRSLSKFNISAEPGDITRGPAITRFEIYPAEGTRVNRITALEANLALATRAERINILAPIPGKNTVGIELANKNKTVVPLRELLEHDSFADSKFRIPVALGKDVYGKPVLVDLASTPHLLVAGATGSGKSVCINGIIACLLCRFAPDEMRLVMIDPKVVEMQNYEDLPHLALPVVTEPEKALAALRWVVKEMEKRYKMFAKVGVRNYDSFNKRPLPPPKPQIKPEPEEEFESPDAAGFANAEPNMRAREEEEFNEIPARIPYMVIIIDELADLMQTASSDIEAAISRITAMARAAGIHLIVATQSPRADVITGLIKANIPSRIAFQVSSALDSRVILDSKGAEKLVGKGDMLFVPPGASTMIRAQGALITDDEIQRLVDFAKKQGKPVFDIDLDEIDDVDRAMEGDVSPEDEETLERCIEVIMTARKASTSLLQRRLKLGYGRASRMIDLMEARGIVGPENGSRPRQILIEDGEY